jgi:hypothetical protein
MKSRHRTWYLAAILGLLATATLSAACGSTDPESDSNYCQDHPNRC